MNPPADLDDLSPEQLRALAPQLLAEVHSKDLEVTEKRREVRELERELHYPQTRIDQLTHEIYSSRQRHLAIASAPLGAHHWLSIRTETRCADKQLPARGNDSKTKGGSQRCRLLLRLAAINPKSGTRNGNCVGQDIAAAFILLVDHHFRTCLEEIGHLSRALWENLRNVVGLGNGKRHG
ncbi:hypothetical protein [Caballeronia zhejiangensis]|uniref:Uncharacterized protein n=1 Tax=Caballeronia zhejiangensis TaxID=871203 RepID=A0A656QCW2_9BURK|nr:hypothetical protein BG58_31790 [Caballeronia jiangsuensis]KDR26109.1 hypothetical protein BG60_24280 [Caballeronia zhejiangensis]KWU24290.1 hypothetical protein AS149_34420 [Burkholderia cenocepacia]SAL77687.1 transposase [Caballeronia peredens]